MGLFKSKKEKAQEFYELGESYYQKKEYAKMFRHYEKAAALGHLQSMHCLGYAYLKGEGVAQDYRKALEWYSMAADRGYGKSQVAAARICYEGHLGAPDYHKAMGYFKAASEQGYIYATAYYGKLIMEFGKTEADKAEGFEKLVTATLEDSSDALGFLIQAMNKSYAVETWETGRVQVVDTATEDVIAYKEHGHIGFYMTYAEASKKKSNVAASKLSKEIDDLVEEALNTGRMPDTEGLLAKIQAETNVSAEQKEDAPVYTDLDELLNFAFSENTYVDKTLSDYYSKALKAFAEEDYVTAYKWVYRIYPGGEPDMWGFKDYSEETQRSLIVDAIDTYDIGTNGKDYTLSFDDLSKNCIDCERCINACPQVFKGKGDYKYIDHKACTQENKLKAYGAYKDCPMACIDFDEY